MRKQLLELLHFLPQLHVTRLRLLLDALEPALDVIAVCNEQLELQRLEVVIRNTRTGEAIEHDEERVDLTQIPEQCRPGAAHFGHANRRRRDLARLHHVRKRVQAGSGIAAMPTSPLARTPVSASKSMDLPELGSPTIPTSSATTLSCLARSAFAARQAPDAATT